MLLLRIYSTCIHLCTHFANKTIQTKQPEARMTGLKRKRSISETSPPPATRRRFGAQGSSPATPPQPSPISVVTSHSDTSPTTAVNPPLSPTLELPWHTNGLPPQHRHGTSRGSLPVAKLASGLQSDAFDVPNTNPAVAAKSDKKPAPRKERHQPAYGIRRVLVTVNEDHRPAMLQMENLDPQQARFIEWAVQRMVSPEEMEMLMNTWGQWSGDVDVASKGES